MMIRIFYKDWDDADHEDVGDVNDDDGDDDNDHDDVQEKADTEWKFARSKLWISYFEACNHHHHHHHHCHCHHHQRHCHGFWFIPIITKSYHGGVTTHLGPTWALLRLHLSSTWALLAHCLGITVWGLLGNTWAPLGDCLVTTRPLFGDCLVIGAT